MKAFRSATVLKRDSNTGIFLWICEIFKNTYFEEYLQTAASGTVIYYFCKKKLHLRCFIDCTLPSLGDGGGGGGGRGGEGIEPFLRRFIGGTSVKLGYWVGTNFSHIYFGIFCLRIFDLFMCPLKLSKKYLLLFSNNSVKVQTLFDMCSQ